jgi:thiol-disulfide isomerase/thioredoxin
MKKFIKDRISDIFGSFTEVTFTLILGSAVVYALVIKFWNLLFISVNILMAYIVIFGIILLFLIYFYISKRFKREQYCIPTRRTLYNGLEPSEYDRRTKWNYKNNSKYYFVPLISHSYDSAEFVDFWGPFCSKCDHFLQTKKLQSNPKYFCVNCVLHYKVPTELWGDYEKKLLAYFKEEYRKGNLKDVHL